MRHGEPASVRLLAAVATASYFAFPLQPNHGAVQAQSITEFAVPTATEFSFPNGCGPTNITTGSDGNLWVVDYTPDGVVIGSITPGAPNDISEFPLQFWAVYSLTNGPDGNLWFTDSDGNSSGIARIVKVQRATVHATA